MLSPNSHTDVSSFSGSLMAGTANSYVNGQIEVWQLLMLSLQQSIPAMLMYVLESNGSSPGRQGFAMAVSANGAMAGSIGGGIMEHKFVEMAKERLKNNADQLPAIKKQVHDKTAAKDQSGMICSGDQTILLYPVSSADIPQIEKIIACLSNNASGTLDLSPAGLVFSDESPASNYSFSMQSQREWLYREMLGYKNHLYIIGGGHCALALSKLMSSMDFYIHLFDHRDALNTIEQNLYAHKKTILDDYSGLKNIIPAGAHHYVVVMTVGYRTDDIAVRALIAKPFAYFGILGSKKKIEKLFSDYIAEGISEEVLQQIHAPIGLAVNSRTPEEIAISIAAEIIQVKNR
ncbi:hypothetical protein BH10BAC3_BH10BAC3_01750 [soil metagenome]